MRRRQTAADTLFRQIIVAQMRAVTDNDFGKLAAFHFFGQVGERDRAVFTQAGQLTVLCLEYGIVDLLAAGIHSADDQTIHMGHIPGHGG